MPVIVGINFHPVHMGHEARSGPNIGGPGHLTKFWQGEESSNRRFCRFTCLLTCRTPHYKTWQRLPAPVFKLNNTAIHSLTAPVVIIISIILALIKSRMETF